MRKYSSVQVCYRFYCYIFRVINFFAVDRLRLLLFFFLVATEDTRDPNDTRHFLFDGVVHERFIVLV